MQCIEKRIEKRIWNQYHKQQGIVINFPNWIANSLTEKGSLQSTPPPLSARPAFYPKY